MKRILSLIVPLLIALPALAQDHTEIYTFNGVNLDIPDGDSVGVTNTQNLDTGVDTISSITISVNISATADLDPVGYNGDLYLYLNHGTGHAMLLNRVGRTLLNSDGYDDSGGFDITFDDAATNDVHNYQDFVAPPGPLPLTLSWQPDARLSDPDFVLDTDLRDPSAFLSAFATLDGDGDWSLFLADMTGGAEHTLNSWSISITGVPEPGTASLLALGALAFVRRRRMNATLTARL